MHRWVFCIGVLALSFAVVVNEGASSSLAKRSEEKSTAEIVSERINQIKGPLSGVASGVKALSTASFMSKYNLLSKFQKILGAIGPGLMVVGVVLSVISAFLPGQESKEMKFMKEKFDIVINGITRIENKVHDLENLVTHENTKVAYGEYQRVILMLYEDWQNAVQAKKPSHEERHRAFFMKQYEMHYKHASLNLLRAMVGYYDGELNNDLLGAAKARYKCDGFRIRKLCATVTQTIVQGLAVESAYYSYLEFYERVDELKETWENRMALLEKKCEEMVVECRGRWREYIDPLVEDVYGKYKTSSNAVLAQQTYNALVNTFGQRAWFVFVYDQKRGFENHGYHPRNDIIKQDIYEKWHENDKMFTVVSFDMDDLPEFENRDKVTEVMDWIYEMIVSCEPMLSSRQVPASKQLMNLCTFGKEPDQIGKFIYAIKGDLNLQFHGEPSRYVHRYMNMTYHCQSNQFLKFHLFQIG